MNRIILVVLVSSLVVSCTTTKVDAKDAMRVYTQPKCPKTGSAQSATGAALSGLVIQALVSNTIKGITNAIKKAGEDKAETKTAFDNNYFYSYVIPDEPDKEKKLQLNVGCITVVYGELSQDVLGEKEQRAIDKRFSEKYTSGLQKDDVATILSPGDPSVYEFTENIKFFGEYQLKLSSDRTAMKLIPSRMLIGKPIDPRAKINKERDYAIIISLMTPAKAATGAAFAMGKFSFDDLKTTSYLSGDDLSEIESTWMPVASIPKSTKDSLLAYEERIDSIKKFGVKADELQLEINKTVDATKKADLETARMEILKSQKVLEDAQKAEKKKLSKTTPVTVSLSITETQDGNKFLAAVGSFLSDNNDAIEEQLTNRLDPSKRDASNETELDAVDELRKKVITTVAAYNEAEGKSGSDRSQSAIDTALIDARSACRKLRNAKLEDLRCLELPK